MKQTTENTKEWIEYMHSELTKKGYFRYIQQYKNSNFQYWKNICKKNSNEKAYQVGVCFYDWESLGGLYLHQNNRYALSFEMITFDEIRQLVVSINGNDISIDKFEQLCENIYNTYNISDI